SLRQPQPHSMHVSHWRRPPNWVAVCTNGTSSLMPTFSPLSAVKEYLRRKPSGCTRMLIEPVFSPPHDHVSLVLFHDFSMPRWWSHASSMLWKLSQVAAPKRIRPRCYLTKSYGFRAIACLGRDVPLPPGIQRDQPAPIAERPSLHQRSDRVSCMPGAWQTRQPSLVLFAAVEPDDRCHHHLPRGWQRLVSASPFGHRRGVHLARAVIKPARADIDAVDALTRIAQEECLELVAGNHVKQVRCKRRRTARALRQAVDVGPTYRRQRAHLSAVHRRHLRHNFDQAQLGKSTAGKGRRGHRHRHQRYRHRRVVDVGPLRLGEVGHYHQAACRQLDAETL